MDVQLQEYRPIQSLHPHVQRFWSGRFDGRRGLAQRVVPSGFVECIFHLTDHHCDLPASDGWRQSPDYTLIGLQSEPYEVRFSAEVEVFAIRFRPAGFFSLFGTPLGEIAGTYGDLEAVVGGRIREFAARIREEPTVAGRLHAAERYLQALARDPDATYLAHAERLIQDSGGGLTVDAVTDRLSVSRRQFERAFRRAFGMSPKQYMRIARVNLAHRLLTSGRHPTLAGVAYAAGYSDQSHFTREFKALVGHTPSRYLTGPSAFAADGTREQRRPELRDRESGRA